MKDIIEMAREAGLMPLLDEDCFQSMGTKNFGATKRVIERFADLVRADERAKFFTPEEARIALEDTDFTWHHSVTQDMVEKLEAIRARSNT